MSDLTTIRPDSIAVSWQTRKGLGYVSKAMGLACLDGLADEILLGWLNEKHPDVVAHLKATHEADNKFRNELKGRLNP